MSKETLLDDAITKAKEAEDWQLVEWLRMARGGEKAAKWYTEKLRELGAENAKLRELMSELWPIACSGSCVDKCAHYDECLPHYEEDGCMLKARMRELGVEVD